MEVTVESDDWEAIVTADPNPRELAANLRRTNVIKTHPGYEREHIELSKEKAYAIAAALERGADAIDVARRTHVNLVGMYGSCPFCEYYEGIGTNPCELLALGSNQ